MEVTLGETITIATIIISAVFSYATREADVKSLKAATATHSEKIDTMDDRIHEVEKQLRITQLEIEQVKIQIAIRNLPS